MGAWSTTAFGNDAALDWLGDLLPGTGEVDWAAQFRTVLQEFADFERRRVAGTNREVRTAEEAEYLIGLVDPPMDPEMAAVIRESVGNEYQDNGDDEAFCLVAAAAVLLAAGTGDLSCIPKEFHGPGLRSATAGKAYRNDVVAALRQVLLNKPLVRDCGSKWKKGVAELADRLEELDI